MNQTSHAHLTVTKNELSEALFDQVGLNKREAKDMIDAFFDRIAESLETGTEAVSYTHLTLPTILRV